MLIWRDDTAEECDLMQIDFIQDSYGFSNQAFLTTTKFCGLVELVGLKCVGLDWLYWIGLNCFGLDWHGMLWLRLD
jgi:hypothetical protein